MTSEIYHPYVPLMLDPITLEPITRRPRWDPKTFEVVLPTTWGEANTEFDCKVVGQGEEDGVPYIEYNFTSKLVENTEKYLAGETIGAAVNSLAAYICGVQPMSGPINPAFTLKPRYAPVELPIVLIQYTVEEIAETITSVQPMPTPTKPVKLVRSEIDNNFLKRETLEITPLNNTKEETPLVN